MLKNIATSIRPSAYTLKGIHKEMQKSSQPTAFLRKARIIQGQKDLAEIMGSSRNSYRNGCNLYHPDRSWDDEPAKRGEEPALALYYTSFGGLVNAVKYLLSQGPTSTRKVEDSTTTRSRRHRAGATTRSWSCCWARAPDLT